jgi:hypothetical protein
VALKVIAENARDGESMMQFLGPNDPAPAQIEKLRKAAKRS